MMPNNAYKVFVHQFASFVATFVYENQQVPSVKEKFCVVFKNWITWRALKQWQWRKKPNLDVDGHMARYIN